MLRRQQRRTIEPAALKRSWHVVQVKQWCSTEGGRQAAVRLAVEGRNVPAVPQDDFGACSCSGAWARCEPTPAASRSWPVGKSHLVGGSVAPWGAHQQVALAPEAAAAFLWNAAARVKAKVGSTLTLSATAAAAA